eukprot:Filipodium_phascolosomae@DN3741_c0_g1_i1.p1
MPEMRPTNPSKSSSQARKNSLQLSPPPSPSSISDAQPPPMKPFAAELGSVNPWIVVPPIAGVEWTLRQLQLSASQLAHFILLNAGHLCARPQVVLLSSDWSQRQQFIDIVRYQLRSAPPVYAFYPNAAGSMVKHKKDLVEAAKDSSIGLDIMEKQAFEPDQRSPMPDKSISSLLSCGSVCTKPQKSMEEQSTISGSNHKSVDQKNDDPVAAGILPPVLPVVFAWDLPFDLRKDGSNPIIFREECFCTVTAEVPVPSSSPADFLEKAVSFCNERLWGSLCATITVDPVTQLHCSEAIENAIDSLQYGAVGLNISGAAAIHFAGGWGAYPKHTYTDIQSGMGRIANYTGIPRVYKTVCRSPLTFVGQAGLPISVSDHIFHTKLWKAVSNFLLNDSLSNLGRVGAIAYSHL